ncbi:hypothetical protein ACIBKY_51480 [Nonomuraea sp. NPDC050394]|uniref:hypothetical protein n=1 Tax=Nonomuraea sp. NPDC050394 TaxID=3364363 RepID=UPI0037BAF299
MADERTGDEPLEQLRTHDEGPPWVLTAAMLLAGVVVVAFIIFVTFRLSDVFGGSSPSMTAQANPADFTAIVVFIIGVVALGVFLVVVFVLVEQVRERRRAERSVRLLRAAEASLAREEALSLRTLWDVTHKRLDYYHEIATSQARRSFRNAQFAMVTGFLLLAVFAYLAITATTTSTAIVTGALGATAAAFGAYVGRTFVRSQESTASHLRAYFNQPLEFSRYLATERFYTAALKELPDEHRAELAGQVLRAMMTPPAAEAAAAADDKAS